MCLFIKYSNDFELIKIILMLHKKKLTKSRCNLRKKVRILRHMVNPILKNQVNSLNKSRQVKKLFKII